MASTKRDRQRANRDLKRADEEQQAKKRHRISVIKRYATYTLIFVVAIVALKLISG